ncbi:MAG TPA: energy transducer TonB [Pyrinomonadaceae bacterium]|jgi:TonB family protein|nr:energy transducer TonB [Pyrinomonadaceae bacterium]
MFNNLIESSSHAREYKRRGSFLLFTTGVYAILLVLGGVASIYAYDARLEEQSLEIVTLLPPVEVVPAQPEEVSRPNQPRETSHEDSGIPERATAMLSVNHPEVVPVDISTAPNKNLPLPESGPVRIGTQDRGMGPAGGPGTPLTGGRVVVPPAQIVTMPDQPPPPDPPKPPRVISKGPITGLAISLPKPAYSEIAKRARIQGSVNVQVLIDEYGRVVSAKAVSGHPLLVLDAQKAALQARFSPTKLGDQPVKVSGVITYNFVLSN